MKSEDRLDDLLRVQVADARAGMTHFLKEFEWHHVFHGTFRFSNSIDLAFKRFRDWSNGLARVAQGKVQWIGFPEITIPGRYHLHGLIHGTAGLPDRMLLERWRKRNGEAEITIYRPDDGIEEYITKAMASDFSEGRFSPGFTPIRRLDLSEDLK